MTATMRPAPEGKGESGMTTRVKVMATASLALVVLLAYTLIVGASNKPLSDEAMINECQQHLLEYRVLDPERTRFPETNSTVYGEVPQVAGIMIEPNAFGGMRQIIYYCDFDEGRREILRTYFADYDPSILTQTDD